MAPSAMTQASANVASNDATKYAAKAGGKGLGNGRAPAHISSAEVIRLEHEYGAHK